MYRERERVVLIVCRTLPHVAMNSLPLSVCRAFGWPSFPDVRRWRALSFRRILITIIIITIIITSMIIITLAQIA